MFERALILSEGPVLDLENELPSVASEPVRQSELPVTHPQPSESEPCKTLEEVERSYIASVLEQTGGVVEGPKGAAKILGIHPNTLRHRIEKLGLKRSAHRIS